MSADSTDKKPAEKTATTFPVIFKEQGAWEACYDKTKNRYLARFSHYSPNGDERFTFLIPQKVFDALDTSQPETKNKELIESDGTLLVRFDDPRDSAFPATTIKYGDEGEEGWSTAWDNVMDEMAARFDEGDESVLYLWEVFASRSSDSKRSRHFAKKAAQKGDRRAQKLLAHAYCYGNKDYGIDVDFDKGEYWCEKVAEEDSAENQNYLAWCFAGGRHMNQNQEKAVYWYTKAAEQGYAEAQEELGYCSAEGKGVAANDEKAAYWFEKAAEQGSADSQFNTGVFYCVGRGVKKDTAKAFQWYMKAAEQGLSCAQHNVGCFYNDGRAGEKNEEKAVYWWTEAAKQGYEPSKKLLDSQKKP